VANGSEMNVNDNGMPTSLESSLAIPSVLTLYLRSAENSLALTLKTSGLPDAFFFFEILANFSEQKDGRLSIKSFQRATPILKEKVESFIALHQKERPDLNRISAFVRRMPTDEWFMVLPESPQDTRHEMHICLYIKAFNSTNNEEDALQLYRLQADHLDREFGVILENYYISVLDGAERTIVGSGKKSGRKCRFCGGKFIDGIKFTKKAHAISEALGNKGIVLGDECDECNQFFGNIIETHLVEFLNVNRAFLGTKGSEGIPQIIYENALVTNVDGVMTVVADSDEFKGDPLTGMSISLVSNFEYIPSRMFKALCKMAISTIGDEELEHLTDTIRWMREKQDTAVQIAKVARAVVHEGFTKTPQIANYVRKSDNMNIPHIVSEFRIGSWVFVFVVPFSAKDDRNFRCNTDFDNFWTTFKHYQNVEWLFDDLSSIVPRKLTVNLSVSPPT
jgi:hypothetical protein